MKRLSIALGIIAIAAVCYYFLVRDRRSRLMVETPQTTYTELHSPPLSVPEDDVAGELSALAQEAVFNESINYPHDKGDEEKMIASLTNLSNALDLSKAPRVLTSQRKLIKTVFLDFQVNNIDSVKSAIESLLKQAEGYLASDNQTRYEGGPQYQQVVRVPSDKLDPFVSQVSLLAKKMKSRNVSTKDVTDEYIDLEARLDTKRELEKNYRSILTKAKTVKDMLEVEEELAEVRGEIESMQGRLQYLGNQVAFSTVSITYYQLIPIVPEDEETFGQRLADSLAFGWDNVLEFIVDLFTAWPVILALSIFVPLVFRLIRRRKPTLIS